MLFPSKQQRYYKLTLTISMALTLLSIPAAIICGTIDISVSDIYQVIVTAVNPDNIASTEISSAIHNIIWQLRIPRALMACITGAGLAIAGLTLQSVTRNSLADPHLLGISSGAVLGAVIVTLHTGDIFGPLTLPFSAFCGSLLAIIVITLIMHSHKMYSASQLLMCGVALSFVLMSAANLALYMGDNRASHQVIFWMLGGLGLARWSHLLLPFIICLGGYAFLRLHARYLNAMLIGDETALSLGISFKRLRLKLFLISALITSILVANTGAIGFIGLMIPHIARFIVGGDLRRLLPISAIFGALFLLWVDVLSRTLLAPMELPIGIITGFIGGLFFIGLLIRSNH
ncbi:iron complex transport system permease protein [Sinobacterium caligoides]|uniref:Iron complex transport system permease protein n=1 Tax=Sinobacterium caligoides TaxID=933926 RepID=A0A3N2DZ61_9GAMM|nr:iron ABC transporter permease [Sinobacterium caligoides]ROS05104.1 iron complex transport system permease protein [Sinobacterium caligoides]